MIQYNPKDWFTFIFRFHKADTFRKLLPLIIANLAYAGVISYLILEVFHLNSENHLKNITIMHSMLGFVISLLLVFRTNTAYERWWEGRKLWGSLVNSSRNLALKLSAFIPDHNSDKHELGVLIRNYAFALKNHLRGKFIKDELISTENFNPNHLRENEHIPNQIAQQIITNISKLEKQGKISKEHLLMLNTEIQNFADVCGACERIKKTPIPFSYSVFIKKFIFFYIMTLPLGYVFSLGYLCVPLVAFIFYVLSSLELIAEEIEDPFGSDANDLPIDQVAETINRSMDELLIKPNAN